MAKHKRKPHKRPRVATVKPSTSLVKSAPAPKPPPPQVNPRHSAPTIPFVPHDCILLIGEADLSFARALILHHGCVHVTATVQERDAAELSEKYPGVEETVAWIVEEGGVVVYGVDATKMGIWGAGGGTEGKQKEGGMDRVVFNFPHVGGKSTDVNRQVRYNQELLVSFFKRAIPSLARGGSIIVTLFEGEPYTLWNIRDLARHCGLQVERSFKFQASAYPGYQHARTFGVVKSRSGKVRAGWKGEDRPARSYVFVRKGEEPREATSKSKRKRNDSDSESYGDD